MDGLAHTYEVERSLILLFRSAMWFFAAMAFLFPFILQVDGAPRLNEATFYTVCGGMFAAFVGLSSACFFALRQASRLTLAIDEQGLWKVAVGKERGLVRWDSVKSVRERPRRQRLELLGYNGERLLDVAYQLRGFDDLRAFIVDRIPKLDWAFPQRHEQRAISSAIEIAPVVPIIAVLWWSVSEKQNWLAAGIVGVLIIGLYELVTSVRAITLWRDHLLLEYPWRKIEIRNSDIRALHFADLNNKGARVPQLAMQLVSGRDIQLRGSGFNMTELYRQLRELMLMHT